YLIHKHNTIFDKHTHQAQSCNHSNKTEWFAGDQDACNYPDKQEGHTQDDNQRFSDVLEQHYQYGDHQDYSQGVVHKEVGHGLVACLIFPFPSQTVAFRQWNGFNLGCNTLPGVLNCMSGHWIALYPHGTFAVTTDNQRVLPFNTDPICSLSQGYSLEQRFQNILF